MVMVPDVVVFTLNLKVVLAGILKAWEKDQSPVPSAKHIPQELNMLPQFQVYNNTSMGSAVGAVISISTLSGTAFVENEK
jgi:hypothetical protein